MASPAPRDGPGAVFPEAAMQIISPQVLPLPVLLSDFPNTYCPNPSPGIPFKGPLPDVFSPSGQL